MSENRYPTDKINDPYEEDDGTMPKNVALLGESVIGHRIVSAGKDELDGPLVLTLDNGTRVELRDTADCCAFTELKGFLAHPGMVDHAIVGVGTTEGYTRWHIYADFGDVLELRVGWSCGNPFYYAYGFDIAVDGVVLRDDW